MCIKTPALHKRQRFDDNKKEETALKKCQWFDKCDNEEGQSLDKNESEVKDNRYILLPLLALPPSYQKEPNCLSDVS